MTRKDRVMEELTFAGRKFKSIFKPKKSKVELNYTVRTDYFWSYKEPGVHTWTGEDYKQFRKTKKARAEEDKEELGEEMGSQFV